MKNLYITTMTLLLLAMAPFANAAFQPSPFYKNYDAEKTIAVSGQSLGLKKIKELKDDKNETPYHVSHIEMFATDLSISSKNALQRKLEAQVRKQITAYKLKITEVVIKDGIFKYNYKTNKTTGMIAIAVFGNLGFVGLNSMIVESPINQVDLPIAEGYEEKIIDLNECEKIEKALICDTSSIINKQGRIIVAVASIMPTKITVELYDSQGSPYASKTDYISTVPPNPSVEVIYLDVHEDTAQIKILTGSSTPITIQYYYTK